MIDVVDKTKEVMSDEACALAGATLKGYEAAVSTGRITEMDIVQSLGALLYFVSVVIMDKRAKAGASPDYEEISDQFELGYRRGRAIVLDAQQRLVRGGDGTVEG